jgi:hypothetical protein
MTRSAVCFLAGLWAGGQQCLLLAACLLVPRGARREWLNEWRGELWQAQRACRGVGFAGPKRTTEFCLGAFQDAACLRRMSSSRSSSWLLFQAPFSARRGSHALCLLGLLCMLCVAACGCILSPGARVAFNRLPPRIDRLALISRQGDFGTFQPTISLSEYRAWTAWTAAGDRLLQGFAFYVPLRTSVRLPERSFHTFNLGYASGNMARVLELSMPQRAAAGSHMPAMVLSARSWESLAKDKRPMPGQAILLGHRRAVFADVANDDIRSIPGNLDGLVFEPGPMWTQVAPETRGFVLSRDGADIFQSDSEGRPYLQMEGRTGTALFECLSLGQRRQNPLFVFLFAVMMACLALPATTPLPLGDYSSSPIRVESESPRRAAFSGGKASFAVDGPSQGLGELLYPVGRKLLDCRSLLRRWCFLATKLILLVPAVGCLSAAAAYTWMPSSDPSATLLQLFSSFGGLLFAFRWTLRDQRSRCPICLATLTSAASVGHPSRCFLAWSGTEMVCPSGHGLLHIPEHPTSWFQAQRWLCLGSSWSELFREHWT